MFLGRVLIGVCLFHHRHICASGDVLVFAPVNCAACQRLCNCARGSCQLLSGVRGGRCVGSTQSVVGPGFGGRVMMIPCTVLRVGLREWVLKEAHSGLSENHNSLCSMNSVSLGTCQLYNYCAFQIWHALLAVLGDLCVYYILCTTS